MRYNKPADESNLFTLDQRLAGDTLRLGTLSLCEVLRFDDRRYDWLIVVPRVAGAVEFLDLDAAQQVQLAREIQQVSQALKNWRPAAKLNVAALGNVVAQLHVHLVLRDEGDAAWPGPVWGHSPAQRFAGAEAAEQCHIWQQRLNL
ncbi:HIT domain-containing protein [Pseudidiomarina insulisalsae]|uniref:Diadenosine tetraphosphate hydrolase n=1 Tax=Pseudidiomarina insulisalsae TaxID=575789 RepID=A0A432YM01_9GAMM|nr:HIT family protein [Pseudidiomarina insulisalsae]RUO61918.1 diadenosine tetraphosphate hydrolase [Pseudidiomarina insulisalsae]